MIKKLIFLLTFFVVAQCTSIAQKVAVIDTKYVLSKLPDYKKAEEKMKALTEAWQKELDEKQIALDKLYKNYEVEQYMLADDLKKKRETELFNKEKELRALNKQRFGYEGDVFKERQKLIKPIQDRVYNVIQRIAVARSYDIVLDKSEGITVIFADPKLDISEDVLKELK